jgi:ATP-dependent Zn protease
MVKSVLKNQSLDYVKIAASYHEAAHAFVAAFNYLKVLEINIIDIKDSYVHYVPIEYEQTEVLISLELQMFYSGLIAEKIYYKDTCGSSIFPANLYGAYDDTKAAAKLIKIYKALYPNRSSMLFKKQTKKYVKQLLQDNWSSIKLIAYYIYSNEKITGEEFKEFLIKKINKQFWRERYRAIEKIHCENKISQSELESIINNIQ